MFTMFGNMFRSLAALFKAAERGANTIDLYAADVEAEAAFACELKQLDRNARIREHKAKLKALEPESKLKALA